VKARFINGRPYKNYPRYLSGEILHMFGRLDTWKTYRIDAEM
jgi:hypothetical protein